MSLTGEAILFLDLSADPGLFDGPKGDRQVWCNCESIIMSKLLVLFTNYFCLATVRNI